MNASPWVRAGAMLADVFVVSVAQLILVFGLDPSDAARGPMAFFLAAVYHVGLLAQGGQTVGKMLAGIVAVTKDEEPLGLKGALLRYLAFCLTAPFGVTAFFDSERRAIHDRLAGTRVVYAGEPGPVRLFFFVALGFAWVAVPVTIFFFALFAVPKLTGVTRVGPAKEPAAPPPAEVAAAFDRAPGAAVQTPAQLPPRPEVAGRTRDVAFNPAVARFHKQVKPEHFALYGARRELEDQVLRAQRAHPERRFPEDLSGLRVPRIKLPEHTATDVVTLYGPEACGESPRLGDTGGWGYVADPQAPCAGAVLFDCVHLDANGARRFR